MFGQVNKCDADQLLAGMPCIIQDLDQLPVLVLWWGRVTASNSWRQVQVVIDGGRFMICPDTGENIMTDERLGERLAGNHRVYPSNATCRELCAALVADRELLLKILRDHVESHGPPAEPAIIGPGYALMT